MVGQVMSRIRSMMTVTAALCMVVGYTLFRYVQRERQAGLA